MVSTASLVMVNGRPLTNTLVFSNAVAYCKSLSVYTQVSVCGCTQVSVCGLYTSVCVACTQVSVCGCTQVYVYVLYISVCMWLIHKCLCVWLVHKCLCVACTQVSVWLVHKCLCVACTQVSLCGLYPPQFYSRVYA